MAESAALKPVETFDIVIFGAAGDLSLRKLIPALFHRWCDGQIPERSRIVAVSRTDETTAAFIARAADFIRKEKGETLPDGPGWAAFTERMRYVGLDVLTPDAQWEGLAGALEGREDILRIFYFALPPSLYGPACRNLAEAGLITQRSRIVLEKPIGNDLQSAKAINAEVGRYFPEEAIFRIDHYLGKETVQNLIVLRFMNSLFEPVWNANGVDHVEITVAEAIGAGGRADYYDAAGALRDMVQNHLLQLLCLVAMEPPLDLEADTIRDEKIKVLRALRPITAANVRDVTVRGQYVRGGVGESVVPGYREELGRASDTETFVAIKAHVDNWRWRGTPFYLRTGKRMASRRSDIIIQFKGVAHPLTEREGGPLQPTRLVIRLQPDEGVKLLLVTKDPGPGGMRLRYVPLNLSYADQFAAQYPDAYERLLMAVVRENLGLFMRRDEVEAAWRWTDGILSAWEAEQVPCHPYPAGTDGPVQAAVLLDRDRRAWYEGA